MAQIVPRRPDQVRYRRAAPEPRGLLIGGIAAGVAAVMADLLSPIYATSFHRGVGLDNTRAANAADRALRAAQEPG